MDTPWFSGPTALTRAIGQLGPLTIIAFVLVWIVYQIALGPLSTLNEHLVLIDRDHQTIKASLDHANDLSLHFQWAQCWNQTMLIENTQERRVAQERCVPPPSKRGDQQSYLFSEPDMVAVQPARSVTFIPTAHAEESLPINARRAEQVAKEQERERKRALCRKTPANQRSSIFCGEL